MRCHIPSRADRLTVQRAPSPLPPRTCWPIKQDVVDPSGRLCDAAYPCWEWLAAGGHLQHPGSRAVPPQEGACGHWRLLWDVHRRPRQDCPCSVPVGRLGHPHRRRCQGERTMAATSAASASRSVGRAGQRISGRGSRGRDMCPATSTSIWRSAPSKHACRRTHASAQEADNTALLEAGGTLHAFA